MAVSSAIDITAFVLVFPSQLHGRAANEVCDQPLDETDKYVILPYFWIPEENMELRVRRDHVPYDVWERQGKLKITEKIDGAVANVMALDRAIRCGNDTSESVYDERGILFL